MWAADFENDPSLGVMEECYSNLRSKSTLFVLISRPFLPHLYLLICFVRLQI